MANQPDASSRPVKLSPEERARRYAELRKRTSLSPLWAEARDPEIHLRWVRNDRNDIAFHRHLGYYFCSDKPETPEEVRSIKTYVGLTNGKYEHGDVILMAVDKDTHEFYQQEDVAYAKGLVGAGVENFKETARRFNVPTFQRDQFNNIIH